MRRHYTGAASAPSAPTVSRSTTTPVQAAIAKSVITRDPCRADKLLVKLLLLARNNARTIRGLNKILINVQISC